MFKCYKCNQVFTRNFNLKRHMNKKVPCKNINKQDKPEKKSQKIQLAKVSQKLAIVSQKLAKVSQVENSTQNYDNNTQEEIINKPLILNNTINKKISIQKQYICKFCNQEFKHKSSLSKHVNHLRCEAISLKKRNNILINKKNKKVKNVKETKLITINNTNNTNNTNSNNTNNSNNTTNNIIQINAFGKENYDSFKEEQILNILNKMYNLYPDQLKQVYFDIPENRNFYLPNKRDWNFVKYYNGVSLIYEKKLKFSNMLLTNNRNQLKKWYDLYKDKIGKKQNKILINLFKDFQTDILDAEHLEDINNYLMKYSDDIKETINKRLK